MKNKSRSIEELIPRKFQLLRVYNVTRLVESAIEFLDFESQDWLELVLEAVLSFDEAKDLLFLIRDFPIRTGGPPNLPLTPSNMTGVDIQPRMDGITQLVSSVFGEDLGDADTGGTADGDAAAAELALQEHLALLAAAESYEAAGRGGDGGGGIVDPAAGPAAGPPADVPGSSAGGASATAAASGAAAADGGRRHSSRSRRLQQTTTGDGIPWHLTKTGVDQAWAVTRGTPEVVVGIVDNGFDEKHPALKPCLWRNLKEAVGKLNYDDDGNTYVDDIHGYNFAGNCDFDWRQPPPSSSPSPASPTPCSGNNDLRPWVDNEHPGRESHGTHVAGIVAATANITARVAGAAPNVKLMLLKVYGQSGFVYAANVVAALNYALHMGAHIVVCAFGPNEVNLSPTAVQLETMANEALVYGAAVQPLQDNGVLLVAAAGNENKDLDALAAVGSTYLPCTLAAKFPVVLCVTASDQWDQLWTVKDGNTDEGPNWGCTTVDIAAPGKDIMSTLSGGGYGLSDGTSMATPLVAGTAALVASVVGATSANYSQAARVKELLLSSADTVPGLAVREGRRLNALRAVLSAQASLNGSYLLTPSSAFYTTNAGAGVGASLLAAGLLEEYHNVTLPAGVNRLTARPDNLTLAQPFDVSVRVLNATAPLTRLESFRYTNTTSSQTVLVLRLRGLLNLNSSGTWSMLVNTTMPLSNLWLTVGKQRVALTTTNTTINFMAPTAGKYDFEMRILNPGQRLELLWAAPAQPGKSPARPGVPPPYLLVVPSYARAALPRYVPNATLLDSVPLASPAGWHVAWDYVVRNATQPNLTLAPSRFVNMSTGLPPSTDPFAPLRYTAMRPDLFPSPGDFWAMASAAAAFNLTSAAYVTQPNSTDTLGAFGLALSHIRPRGAQLQFQVACASCRLFVQGVLVADAAQSLQLGSSGSPPLVQTVQSGCLTLNTTATGSSGGPVLTLELRFALTGNTTGGNASVITVLYRNCSSGSGAGAWSGLGPLLTSGFMWAPNASGALVARGALQCDMWAASSGAGSVPSPRDTPPLASVRIPRDVNRTNSPYQRCIDYSRPALYNNCATVIGLALIRPLDIKPDIESGEFHVRCWTYWAGGFQNASMTMRMGFASANVRKDAATFLGGTMVYKSMAPSTNNDPDAFRSFAPLASSLGPYYQLLAFEYMNVDANDPIGLVNGNNTFNDRDTLLVDGERMILPA